VELVKNLTLPELSIIFTIDIDSLYTNIDIMEGIARRESYCESDWTGSDVSTGERKLRLSERSFSFLR